MTFLEEKVGEKFYLNSEGKNLPATATFREFIEVIGAREDARLTALGKLKAHTKLKRKRFTRGETETEINEANEKESEAAATAWEAQQTEIRVIGTLSTSLIMLLEKIDNKEQLVPADHIRLKECQRVLSAIMDHQNMCIAYLRSGASIYAGTLVVEQCMLQGLVLAKLHGNAQEELIRDATIYDIENAVKLFERVKKHIDVYMPPPTQTVPLPR